MSEIIIRELTIVPEGEEPTKPEALRCSLCGWVIEDPALASFEGDTARHYDRTCPKGTEKPAPKKRSTTTKPERKLAEGAGIVVKEMKIVGVRGAHAECDHAPTKSARAACRKAKAAGK